MVKLWSMTTETITAIQLALQLCKRTDPALSDAKINEILNLCRQDDSSVQDRAISREAAAYLIGRSVKTVDYHCSIGNLRKIKGKNCSRACGISLLSLQKSFDFTMPNLLAALNDYELNYKKSA